MFWQETVEIVGFVSGIAGIVTLLLPASGWKNRAIRAIWVITVAIAAGSAGQRPSFICVPRCRSAANSAL